MTQETESYVNMFRKFGNDLGLPRLDVDKLVEGHRKNLEALAQSAKVAAEGARSVAQKQREVFEAGLREASELARNFQPLGSPQENLTKQTEFAKKVFDIAMQGARDTAESSRQSSADALKIIQDRMKESWEEFRGSLNRKA